MKYAVISSSRITEQMENFVKRQTQSVYGSKKVLLLSRIVAFLFLAMSMSKNQLITLDKVIFRQDFDRFGGF